MSLESSIVTEYAKHHQQATSRILEGLSPDPVDDLLKDLELETRARLIDVMLPHAAASHLGRCEGRDAALVIEALTADRAANLLRRLDSPTRETILKHLPEPFRLAVGRSLRFATETAGAMMDPLVFSTRPERSVAEIRQALSSEATALRFYVYAVDEDGRLVGVVSLRELFTAPEQASLHSLMASPVECLRARAERDSVIAHPGWQRFPVLPVVDARDTLVGVLRYESFRQLLTRGEGERSDPMDLVMALGELFWFGAAGMLRGFSPERRR